MIAIDTNILVYAFDASYAEKRNVCKKIVEEVFEGRKNAVVTNQILAEFAMVVTRKIEKPITREETLAIVGAILTSKNWTILNYTGETVLNTLKAPQNFWDALIIQTLKEHNIQKIITEDTDVFASAGFIAQNPFK